MTSFFKRYGQRTSRVALRAALLAVVAIMPVSVAAGTSYPNQKNFVYIPKDQTIEGNLYRVGESVEVHGDVNGDVIVAGGSIKITGAVSGDVIAAGGRIQISGPVQGDLRLAGGEIFIDSVVGKNATIAGGNVSFSKLSAVGWEALVFAGLLDMQGRVQKDLRGAVGAATLNGPVGRDVWLKVGEPNQLMLQPQTNITGNFTYLSPTPATILSGATVKGEVKYQPFAAKPNPNYAKAAFFAFLAFKLISMLSLWIVGLVLIWLVPKGVERFNRNLEKHPARALGYGAIVFFATPPVVILLALSIIGIPLAVILTLSYIAYLMLGFIVAATYLGDRLLRKAKKRPWHVSLNWAMVLGVAVLVIITSIPFFGPLIKVAAILYGMGAIIILKLEEYKRWR